jgi:hypothetical protein
MEPQSEENDGEIQAQKKGTKIQEQENEAATPDGGAKKMPNQVHQEERTKKAVTTNSNPEAHGEVQAQKKGTEIQEQGNKAATLDGGAKEMPNQVHQEERTKKAVTKTPMVKATLESSVDQSNGKSM